MSQLPKSLEQPEFMKLLMDAMSQSARPQPEELTVEQLKSLPPVQPGFVQEIWPAERVIPESEVLLAAQDFGYKGEMTVKKCIDFLEKANLARFASRQ